LKVLVTGAGGYIGSVLVPMLLEVGHEVVAVDRFLFGREVLPQEAHGLTVVQEDVRRIHTTILEGLDAVVDLAALSNDPAGELDPEKTWEINHRARVRLARMAKERGVRRYLLPSSCSVYGFQDGLLDESSPPNPLTTYAKANLQAEREVLPLADAHFVVVVIRQATVYGYSPRMRFDLAINGMVRGFFRNGKIPILRDGTQWRPFVHVRDTCRAILMLLDAPGDRVNAEVFNVGADEQNVQIIGLAQRWRAPSGSPFRTSGTGCPTTGRTA
jgi:nucleoside-diphosphate-sugar epimerase